MPWILSLLMYFAIGRVFSQLAFCAFLPVIGLITWGQSRDLLARAALEGSLALAAFCLLAR